MIVRTFILSIFLFISSFSYSQSKKDSRVGELEMEIEEKQLLIDSLDFYLQVSKIALLKQNEKKKIWMKIAISEIVIVGGASIAIATGLWVPVFMGVAVVELFIITEAKYRLNLKTLKSKRAIYQRNKPDGKLEHK